LNNCLQIDLNNKIKEQTIQLKKQNQIKLPDAIIAATAIVNKVPLVTADKGFSKVKGLNLILI
jgi:predicted nucleic acid-binding protein